ncbi:hypothetical protein [Brevundimonas vesicularis]|uniref:hypothetical protein n=1 Tax=Brevundimonas vesicularis TaxID=41276 RepID=UPI0038D4874F
MKMPWIRLLGWLVLVLLAIGLMGAVARSVGLVWDPFGRSAMRLERAERRAEQAEAERLARQLEAEGAIRRARSEARAHEALQQVAVVTAGYEQRAREAGDAETPLDGDRADRLHGHDRELCRLAVQLAGCAATPDTAGRAEPSLSAEPVAVRSRSG